LLRAGTDNKQCCRKSTVLNIRKLNFSATFKKKLKHIFSCTELKKIKKLFPATKCEQTAACSFAPSHSFLHGLLIFCSHLIFYYHKLASSAIADLQKLTWHSSTNGVALLSSSVFKQPPS